MSRDAAVSSSNRIASRRSLRGEEAYVYGLKARAARHHCLGYGTFSVEVDRVEEIRRRYSRERTPVSLLPFCVKAVALAVARNPEANAILFRSLLGFKIASFERVDVNLPITRILDGRRISFVGTIRDAASKSLAAIQEELTAYRRGPPGDSFAIQRILGFARMPLWLARFVHWRMTWSPDFYIRSVGTCALTYLEGSGYERFFPIAPTSVAFGIGAVSSEAVVRGGQIVSRRLMKCTLMIDNFVVSGPVALRLAQDFKELLESPAFAEAELAGAPLSRSLVAGGVP